jgi:anti-sigma factor RsiW
METTCQERELTISFYVDGELSAAETAELESHLAVCSECRRVLAEMQKMEGLFNEARNLSPDTGTDFDAIWENLEKEVDFSPSSANPFQPILAWFKRPWTLVPLAVAATAAVALLVFNMPQPIEKPTQIARSRVESVSFNQGSLMVMQTEGSGVPLIWMLPASGKTSGEVGS